MVADWPYVHLTYQRLPECECACVAHVSCLLVDVNLLRRGLDILGFIQDGESTNKAS